MLSFEPYLEKYPQINYVGSVGPEKRKELVGSARALLHPIQFSEPFGLSVVEVMVCGTPVIAFLKGSMPEIIEHEKTGFLVNTVEEAVEALCRLPKISRYACRQRVEDK
ncbi:MAG: glycosyltransferase [Spirochaetales bacterium]